jgi:hypothetical protein
LLAAPDRAISSGEVFKDGGTTTVARIVVKGRALLIKRYNLKNLRHALGRLWRPSRAWHSWREAHRLQFFDIPTPRPLALIEERCGPLRRRAWLICEYCPGPNLLRHLSADSAPPAEVRARPSASYLQLCADIASAMATSRPPICSGTASACCSSTSMASCSIARRSRMRVPGGATAPACYATGRQAVSCSAGSTSSYPPLETPRCASGLLGRSWRLPISPP